MELSAVPWFPWSSFPSQVGPEAQRDKVACLRLRSELMVAPFPGKLGLVAWWPGGSGPAGVLCSGSVGAKMSFSQKESSPIQSDLSWASCRVPTDRGAPPEWNSFPIIFWGSIFPGREPSRYLLCLIVSLNVSHSNYS